MRTINSHTAINNMNNRDSDRTITRIYGGPGCGKTEHLLTMLTDILQHTKASDIAFVSFTNKGVNEGIDRAVSLMHNIDKRDLPYWGTLHSICNRSACKGKGKIITQKDYKEFSKMLGMKFVGYFTEDLKHDDDIYLFMNHLEMSNSDKAKEIYNMIPDIMKYRWVVTNYQSYKLSLIHI